MSNADWEWWERNEGKYTKKVRIGIKTPALEALFSIYGVKDKRRMVDKIRCIEAGVLKHN